MEKKVTTSVHSALRMSMEIRKVFRNAIKIKGLELLASTALPEEIEEFKVITNMTDNPYQLIWWNVNNEPGLNHIPSVTTRVDMDELVIWYDGKDNIPVCKLDTEVSFDELAWLLAQISGAIDDIDRENDEFRDFLVSVYKEYGK